MSSHISIPSHRLYNNTSLVSSNTLKICHRCYDLLSPYTRAILSDCVTTVFDLVQIVLQQTPNYLLSVGWVDE
jgi:hypothetical protein